MAYYNFGVETKLIKGLKTPIIFSQNRAIELNQHLEKISSVLPFRTFWLLHLSIKFKPTRDFFWTQTWHHYVVSNMSFNCKPYLPLWRTNERDIILQSHLHEHVILVLENYPIFFKFDFSTHLLTFHDSSWHLASFWRKKP